jgi:hypothetical protein
MTFAAPAAGRVAAGSGATAKAGAKASPKAKATPKAAGASVAKAPKAATAPDRARQLVGEGRSRRDAAKILRDEFGSTEAEALGLVDDVSPSSTAGSAGAGSGAPPADPAATRRPTGSPPSPPKVIRRSADAAGGVILGTLAYVLALTYLRGGSEGVKAWLRAKFLNQVEG